jgi:DNA-binding response OmpR family regulator
MNRILIVEDDPCTRTIYRNKFQAEDFEVEAVADGQSAIEKLKASPPDLLILDLMLPEISGVDVLKFVRGEERTKELPVIVLSNAYERSMIESAQKAGANLCLSKTNCNPRNLLHEVRTLLAAPRPQTSLSMNAAKAAALPTVERSEKIADGELMREMRERVIALRQSFQTLGKSDEATRSGRLLELRRAVHGVAGGAALAGCTHLAQMSCALEALLNELHSKPQKLNPSSLRTMAQAVDLLASLAETAGLPQSDSWKAPRILVVDDEPISRQTVCAALKKADLPAMAVEDPAAALKLLEENQFDLVFLDVEMPGLNGFEVCKKLRATPVNTTTPVVFVTALTDFETRARSNLSGGTDIIAKPVLLIELAVKALIHLLRARPNAAAKRLQPEGLALHHAEARLAA